LHNALFSAVNTPPRRAEGEPLAEADWAIGSGRGNYMMIIACYYNLGE